MKLNRKGFTLVELLAVIVILAIVVGIALTTVLPTLKKSRQEAFELTANTAADYLEKQYQLTLIGDLSGATLEMEGGIPMKKVVGEEYTGPSHTISADDFKRAGLKADNYVAGVSTWYIDPSTGRACVWLKARTGTGNQGGEYYDVSPKCACSTGCDSTCIRECND